MSDSEEDAKEKQLKVVFLGDPNVGKTNIIRKYCYEEFTRPYVQTIGADFYIKRINLPGKKEVTIRMSDVGGTEINGHMLKNYLFNVDIIVLVYDITSCPSFDSLASWLDCINSFVEHPVILAVFGNKCDIEHKRAVRLDKTNHFVSENGLTNYFVSAKTGENVTSCMTEIIAKYFGIQLTKLEKENQMSVIKAELIPSTPLLAKPVKRNSTSSKKSTSSSPACVLQ